MKRFKDKYNHYLIFILEKKKYAISVSAVERIYRAVNITPLPEGPDILKGIIKIGTLIVPVINIRKRFLLPDREIELSDHLITVRTKNFILALPVDEVTGLMEIDDEHVEKKNTIFPDIKYIEGVIKLSSDIIIIHNLDEFLFPDEEAKLVDITGEKREYSGTSAQNIK
ncbi:MAG: chemotaxis protein CheW [Candidatus Eremiobacterota bacterium]